MPSPRPLPPSLPDSFTVPAALDAGVTPRRLRASDLEAPFRGVRARFETASVLGRAEAYAPLLRAGEHFSHATAIALAGGWIPARLEHALDVAAIRPVGRPRGDGIRGHETTLVPMAAVGGMPVAAPAVAWCQAATQLTLRELVIAGDSLLRRHDPVVPLGDLADTVVGWVARRGVVRLRAALELVRERTDSVRETELRLDAEARGIRGFTVNTTITDEAGRFVAFGDLAMPEFRVLLEYDGEQHRLDDAQYARDIRRLDALARLGWRVIRVHRGHTGAERDRVFDALREALVSRGWRP